MTSSMGARVGWLWAAVAVMACTLACTGSRPQPESAPMAAGSAAAASTAAGSRASAPLPVHVAPRTRGHVTAPVRARLTAAVVARTVTLHVYTVPPEPGVKLLFDGQPVTTDAAGVAVINTPYRLTGHTLKLVRPQWASDHGRVTTKFTVWRSPVPEQRHSPTLTHLILRRNHAIQLGFRKSYRLNFSFVTTGRQSVPSSRVSGVELRADGGTLNTVTGRQTMRLPGVKPVQEAGTLVAHTVNYTLQSVMVDGSNVVNVGQQRVNPTRQASAKFVLQLRQLTITAHDRFFGMRAGRAVVVTYPDGRRVSYRFNQAHQVVLTDLARGHYQVHVDGGGFLTSQAVVLSRNQIVSMPVLTWPDIVAVIVVLGAVTAVAVMRQRRGSRAASAGGQTE
jgi:hypothetical protein